MKAKLFFTLCVVCFMLAIFGWFLHAWHLYLIAACLSVLAQSIKKDLKEYHKKF